MRYKSRRQTQEQKRPFVNGFDCFTSLLRCNIEHKSGSQLSHSLLCISLNQLTLRMHDENPHTQNKSVYRNKNRLVRYGLYTTNLIAG